MKTLIISDTHVSNDFEQAKYDFLAAAIRDCDQVIINGDLWEGMVITFDQFLQSRWKGLFPLLKKKNAIYLYGNHDKESRCDERVSEFCVADLHTYTLPFSKYTLCIEHGNKLISFEEEYKFLHFVAKVTGDSIFIKFFDFVEYAWIALFTLASIQNHHQRHNDIIKQNWKKAQANSQKLLVIGHTHAADFDLDHKFINGGFIKHGVAQYVLITDGKLELVKEHYRTKKPAQILHTLDLGTEVSPQEV